MRNLRRSIFASMTLGLLLSVAASAAPIDLTSIEYAVPAVSIEYDRDVTAMTANDFVAKAPYVVTLDVATPVPIEHESLALLEVFTYSDNVAVVQNVNFERQ